MLVHYDMRLMHPTAKRSFALLLGPGYALWLFRDDRFWVVWRRSQQSRSDQTEWTRHVFDIGYRLRRFSGNQFKESISYPHHCLEPTYM